MLDVPMIERKGWNLHEWAPEQDWSIIGEVYERDAYAIRRIVPSREEEVILDVGACIGAFERIARERNPRSRIICVEVCPENVGVLRANVGPQTQIVRAAVSYHQGTLGLLNAALPDSGYPGGSIVCSGEHLDHLETTGQIDPGQYHVDRRAIDAITIEGLAERYSLDFIDILKLDCEGSEIDILEHCDLSRIGMIVGEYHEKDRFKDLFRRRFTGTKWHMRILASNERAGIFWMARV